MKATGIIRRIDDLGRIVIPKEIRRNLRMKEGDPLEIFVEQGGEVILKKYSAVSRLVDVAKDYIDALCEVTGHTILLSDKEKVIASHPNSYVGKEISPLVENVMEMRHSTLVTSEEEVAFVAEKAEHIHTYYIAPMITGGDLIGAIIAFSKKKEIGESDQKIIDAAVCFLARLV